MTTTATARKKAATKKAPAPRRPSDNGAARAAVGAHDKAALIERIKSRKKRIATHVDLVHNDAVGPALAEALQELSLARTLAGDDEETDPRFQAAQRRAEAAQAAFEEECTRLWFRALPRDEFEALILAHPPTEQQKADAKEQGAEEPTYDVDALLPVLVSACSWDPPTDDEIEAAKEAGEPEPQGVQPLFDVAEIIDLTAEWNQAEVERCWHACLYVNTTLRAAHGAYPKG